MYLLNCTQFFYCLNHQVSPGIIWPWHLLTSLKMLPFFPLQSKVKRSISLLMSLRVFNCLTIYSLLGDADLMGHCPVEVRQAGGWNPLLQSYEVCTWTHLNVSNKIRRNYMAVKIMVCTCCWGKCWTKRHNDKKTSNCHFWRIGSKKLCVRSKSRVLRMSPCT